MTHPATKNNHETHKASIVKWYCPNLMGSDTSNYPPWCCWHQWTFINTRALAANSCINQAGTHLAVIEPLRANKACQCPVSPLCASWYQCQCWHCHILVTLSCLAWHRVTILHHATRTHDQQAQIMVSFPSPYWSPSLNADLWLAASGSALTRYLHNFSFISAPWLGPAQYTGHNEYSSPEEWSACDVWLLRYSNIKCDNNGPRDITAASLCVLPLV